MRKKRAFIKLRIKKRSFARGASNIKKLLLTGGVVVLVIMSAWLILLFNHTNQTINTISVSKESTVIQSKNISTVLLNSYGSYLYKTRNTGLEGAKEFIEAAPLYNNSEIIPRGLSKNFELSRSVDDSDDPFLRQNNKILNNQHFFFTQTVGGVPLYGGELSIHIRNGNEVYSVDGSFVKSQKIETQTITDDQAKDIAMRKANLESAEYGQLSVIKIQKYIYNKKVLKLEDDDKNYLILDVQIQNDKESGKGFFDKEYFVDLATGEIIYIKNNVRNAKNITVTDKRGGGGSLVTGAGGAAPSPVGGDGLLDKIYGYMSAFYDYFFTTFQRDGLDGKGGQMKATLAGPCRNGSSDGKGNISLCSDCATQDTVTHELGHGIVFFSADFSGGIEGEALHEGFADLWSIPFNRVWSQDNCTAGAILRDLANPTSKKQPEKLFSTNWKCGGDGHTLGVLLGHTAALMSKGGTENGCTITGIGDDSVFKIFYLGLTKYLKSTANFLDVYTAMNNACNDLFQQGSATCTSVQAAMMATELDQQTAGTKDSPKCSNIAEKTPICPSAASLSGISTAPSSVAATLPAGGGVPSPACIGNCPTPMTTPTTAAAAPTQAVDTKPTIQQQAIPTTAAQTVQNPTQFTTAPTTQLAVGGNQGGNFIDLIINLIKRILELILRFFGHRG